MIVDLLFPVMGSKIPVDHNYILYGALSRIVPAFHEKNSYLRFQGVNGFPAGDGQLDVTDSSRLRIRLPDNCIAAALTLAGKRLELEGHILRLGVPSVMMLIPADRLYARFVTIKNSTEPEPFLTKVRERLAEMEIGGVPQIPLRLSGTRIGEMTRRVLRVKDRSIVGFALIVDNLSSEDSIKLQSEGLGGRTHMGAGFFIPAREDLK